MGRKDRGNPICPELSGTRVHRVQPSQVVVGARVKTPRAFLGPSLEASSNPSAQTLTQVHRDRVGEFKRLYETTHQNLKSAYQRQAKYYNLQRRDVNYELGDLVMRRTHVLYSAADAVVGKLAPKFHGPCEVIRRRGMNMYELNDCETGQGNTVHVKDLKPFHPRK